MTYLTKQNIKFAIGVAFLFCTPVAFAYLLFINLS